MENNKIFTHSTFAPSLDETHWMILKSHKCDESYKFIQVAEMTEKSLAYQKEMNGCDMTNDEFNRVKKDPIWKRSVKSIDEGNPSTELYSDHYIPIGATIKVSPLYKGDSEDMYKVLIISLDSVNQSEYEGELQPVDFLNSMDYRKGFKLKQVEEGKEYITFNQFEDIYIEFEVLDYEPIDFTYEEQEPEIVKVK